MYFDRIVLINLDKRKDRLGSFKAKILSYPSLHGYIRYRAVHGDTVTVPGFFISGGGAYGCRQSHLRVLEDAMMDGVNSILVLEDDVRFVPNFEEKLKAFMKVVPDDWEGLMLGGQSMDPGPSPTGIDGVMKAHNTQRTHAYVVRGLEPMQDLYRLWARCDRHIDHWFGQWQVKHAVYQPDPWLCGQDETPSDISGRKNEAVRYWNRGLVDAKNHPMVVLISDRSVAESLRNLGFHFGYTREPISGKDRGLTNLELTGWPAEGTTHWGNIIVHEALERGDVPGIWHLPIPDAKFLESRFNRPIKVVEARTVEEAVQKIPELLANWKASKIVWCWQGEGMELLEGMTYHGWHRGYWKDEVSGLDQGIRQAVDGNKYHFIKQIVRQLEKEIDKIRYGKIFLAHPQLDISRVRDELPAYDVRELKGDDIEKLINSYEVIIKEAIGMYLPKREEKVDNNGTE